MLSTTESFFEIFCDTPPLKHAFAYPVFLATEIPTDLIRYKEQPLKTFSVLWYKNPRETYEKVLSFSKSQNFSKLKRVKLWAQVIWALRVAPTRRFSGC